MGRPAGLNERRELVFAVIASEGSVSTEECADILGLSVHSAARILGHLLRRGWIRKIITAHDTLGGTYEVSRDGVEKEFYRAGL